MKRILTIVLLAGAISLLPTQLSPQSCTTIKDGGLIDSAGNPIATGYDPWGYNYQAHMYNGLYGNYDRPSTPYTEESCDATPYGCDNLQMKWNDAWLSNKDCGMDGVLGGAPDGKLDRYYGYESYIGSGAWLTNHQSGTYELDGKLIHWTWFVKIVAAPADAYPSGGYWYTADGTEIGPVLWGSFAVIQEVYNDPGAAVHGIQYKSPASPGWGAYKP